MFTLAVLGALVGVGAIGAGMTSAKVVAAAAAAVAAKVGVDRWEEGETKLMQARLSQSLRAFPWTVNGVEGFLCLTEPERWKLQRLQLLRRFEAAGEFLDNVAKTEPYRFVTDEAQAQALAMAYMKDL